MKRIYSNSDLCISVDEIPNIGEHFIINFYTTSKEYTIQKSDQDLIVEQDGKQVLKLNWTELATIGRGVLQYILTNTKTDADYDDGKYDNTFSKTTDYFIVTDLIIDDGDDEKNIREVLADLENQINAEVTRSTNKDDELDDDYLNLSQRLAMEETARQNGDTQLQNNLDTVDARLTNALSTKASTTDISMLWNSMNSTQSDLNQLTADFEYERNARKEDDDIMEAEIDAIRTDLRTNYQPLLTAGTGIMIANNVISATGGSSSDKQDKLTNGYVVKIVDEQGGSSGTLHKLQLVNEAQVNIDNIATSEDPFSHWAQGDDHTLATIGLVKSHIPTNVSAFTNDAGYLTQHQSLQGFATEYWVEQYNLQQRYAHMSDLSGLQPTLTAGSNINIDTSHNVISANLSNYYTKTEIDAMIGDIETLLSQI